MKRCRFILGRINSYDFFIDFQKHKPEIIRWFDPILASVWPFFGPLVFVSSYPFLCLHPLPRFQPTLYDAGDAHVLLLHPLSTSSILTVLSLGRVAVLRSVLESSEISVPTRRKRLTALATLNPLSYCLKFYFGEIWFAALNFAFLTLLLLLLVVSEMIMAFT